MESYVDQKGLKMSTLSYLRGEILILLILILVLLNPVTTRAQFVKGGDTGWLPQMEANGFKFYDSTGARKDGLRILREAGINTVRLRVWLIHRTIK